MGEACHSDAESCIGGHEPNNFAFAKVRERGFETIKM